MATCIPHHREWQHDVVNDSDDGFKIELESTPDDVLTVGLEGDLDLAEADWVEDTLAAATPHHRRVDVVLDKVTFLDSGGLRAIVTLVQRAGILHLDLRLCRPSPAVKRTLGAAGLLELIEDH
jgi:anti-anti-sigma factor